MRLKIFIMLFRLLINDQDIHRVLQKLFPAFPPASMLEIQLLYKRINEQRVYIAQTASDYSKSETRRRELVDSATAVKNRLHMELSELLDRK